MNDLISSFEEYYREEFNQPGFTMPTKWEVCSTCRGEGTSTAYLGAYTQADREAMGEEWYDFMEDVTNGMYDQPCPTCNGRTTVRVLDSERAVIMTGNAWSEWLAFEQDAYDLARVEAMERRMGA